MLLRWVRCRHRHDGHERRVSSVSIDSSPLSLFQYTQSVSYCAGKTARRAWRSTTFTCKAVCWLRARSIAALAISRSIQHTDALGSPVATSNEAGQKLGNTDYEPYGAVLSKPSFNGIGYTGHVMDGATGLVQMQQRYYDPGIGSFLSIDPVAVNAS